MITIVNTTSSVENYRIFLFSLSFWRQRRTLTEWAALMSSSIYIFFPVSLSEKVQKHSLMKRTDCFVKDLPNTQKCTLKIGLLSEERFSESRVRSAWFSKWRCQQFCASLSPNWNSASSGRKAFAVLTIRVSKSKAEVEWSWSEIVWTWK